MTNSPEGQEGDKLGAGHGPAEADKSGEPEVLPDVGGYDGRDSKSDMPRIPTVPETQDDPKSHDAAPNPSTPEEPGSHGGAPRFGVAFRTVE